MLTYEQAVERAKAEAFLDTVHGYTQVDNFEPHEWVVRAIMEAAREAHAEGRQDGYDEGYQNGFDDGFC